MIVEYKKIEDVASVVTGGTPATGNFEYWDNGDIPWLQSGCCQNCDVNKAEKYITIKGLKNSNARIMPPNTVMIALTGATAGKIGYLNFEACGNQSITGILPNDELNQRYLYYYLLSKREMILADCIGGAQPHISQGYVKKLTVPIRPLNLQNKIVKILTGLTNCIANKNREIQILDLFVKARFVEMFGIPSNDTKGWGLKRLDECCVINPKKSNDKHLIPGLTVSFVPMTAVSENGRIATSKTVLFDNVKSGFTYFKENDVLFAKITPCMENGKGAIARGMTNKIGFGSTEFHVLRPINGVSNSSWIYILTTFIEFRKSAAKNMTGTAGQRRVPATFLESYKISLPPIKLQDQFADFVAQVDKSKFVLVKSIGIIRFIKFCRV